MLAAPHAHIYPAYMTASPWHLQPGSAEELAPAARLLLLLSRKLLACLCPDLLAIADTWKVPASLPGLQCIQADHGSVMKFVLSPSSPCEVIAEFLISGISLAAVTHAPISLPPDRDRGSLQLGIPPNKPDLSPHSHAVGCSPGGRGISHAPASFPCMARSIARRVLPRTLFQLYSPQNRHSVPTLEAGGGDAASTRGTASFPDWDPVPCQQTPALAGCCSPNGLPHLGLLQLGLAGRYSPVPSTLKLRHVSEGPLLHHPGVSQGSLPLPGCPARGGIFSRVELRPRAHGRQSPTGERGCRQRTQGQVPALVAPGLDRAVAQ